MAGRIRDDDVALVRERSGIAEIVGGYLQLKSAGGGRLKGLCPFHDEKTPSFNVNPATGFYHCFGCGQGGDVITFVREMEHLSFTEAVEWLARRSGVELRYEQGSAAARSSGSQRARLLEAHKAAQEFYAEQLRTVEAGPARDFLKDRGFDESAAATFGIGYAPAGFDTTLKLLVAKGFTREELTTAGLAKTSSRGTLIDTFIGRLVWPIRDITGDVVGFNARKLRDDDPGPKYLNSPETPIFKKSNVLFGLDLAKGDIAKRHQAVVVEGASDVMACHLAGVTTAVATCGTAFGDEHIKLIRRLLMDQDEFRGEVVFTFDGDAAGQKAAIKAFSEDQKFVTQTFVAVEPGGMDPCDLRLAKGDAAVRDLVAARVPLFEFVIRTEIGRYDLETPEGRVQALTAAAPKVAGIKDQSLRPEYSKRLAGWLGMDVEVVSAKVGELTGHAAGAQRRAQADSRPPVASVEARGLDAAVLVEREALKLAMQEPALAAGFDALSADLFTHPGHKALYDAISKAGGVAAATDPHDWVEQVREAAADDAVRRMVTAASVEAPLCDGPVTPSYADAQLSRLQELGVVRRITELKGRLQRLDPVEAAEEHTALFTELVGLEQRRRDLARLIS